MFLFLPLLAYVVAAKTATKGHCCDPEQSPHLHQRAWVDGERHCSYRDRAVFESQSREFDKLVGPNPKAKALITGDAMKLSAHEGAVFLEHGAEGEAAASLLFTTKPYEHSDGRRVAAVKRLVIDGPTAGKLDTLFESETVLKSNFGRPTPSTRRRYRARTRWPTSRSARASTGRRSTSSTRRP